MSESARYEELVAELARTLLRNRDASDVRGGSRNRRVGISGVRHQLDVSFVDRNTSPHTLVVVECKHLRYSIKLWHVKVLKSTIDDLAQRLGADSSVKGIIVSICGAQSGAITYAKYHNIDLQLVLDGPSFRFKYADLELKAESGTAFGAGYAVAVGVALHPCKLCGLAFARNGTPEVCPSCAAAT
ncbi:MAG: hypothetical protein H0U97_00790 [Gammaproteobacteria bacterium]|nr:hypothetical protein [Gammaproteobacteria bacterium]